MPSGAISTPDERGSITAVADKDGNVLHINRYDEYGIPVGRPAFCKARREISG